MSFFSDSSIELSDDEAGFCLAPDQPLVQLREDGLLLLASPQVIA